MTGSTQIIIEQLKEIEASGVSEVILCFNYGLKPDDMVREQMDRFMREIAPSFQDAHSGFKL